MTVTSEDRPAWMTDANCAGLNVDIFFPSRTENVTAVKAICRACDVQAQCLAYAMNNFERHGIWGGLSERERRQMRRTGRLKVAS